MLFHAIALCSCFASGFDGSSDREHANSSGCVVRIAAPALIAPLLVKEANLNRSDDNRSPDAISLTGAHSGPWLSSPPFPLRRRS